MRLAFARPLTAAAVLYGAATVAVTGPPAAAVTESQQVLVTSQWGGTGCANNQRLIVANPFTGSIVPGGNLGTPNTQFDVFNEAKPFDSNRKIVALWGGSNNTDRRGGVGVYDRVVGQWIPTNTFYIPTSYEDGGNNPHSITVLPDGYFAIAHVGTITGVSGSGFVVIFSPTGQELTRYGLSSAHGVEYDPRTNTVYAVGAGTLSKWTYNTTSHTLSGRVDYPLPTSGGHDLRRRRNDNKYSVTTNTGSYIFDPAAGTFATQYKADGTTPLGGGVKSIDQRFDGLVEYNYYNQTLTPADTFNFLDGDQNPATFCTNFYKAGRWLYAVGDPDFDNGGGGSTPTWSPTFTVGGGANSWWIEIFASSDVVSLDVIGKNGQFFMSNVTKQSWGAFAQSPPQEMTAGSLIKLIGRKADGSSAGSVTFPWLQTTNPATETGWNASFTIHQCAGTLSATISTAAVAAKVRIGTADWVSMTKNTSTGRWERAGGVPVGTKYLIRAYLGALDSDPKSYDVIRTC